MAHNAFKDCAVLAFIDIHCRWKVIRLQKHPVFVSWCSVFEYILLGVVVFLCSQGDGGECQGVGRGSVYYL